MRAQYAERGIVFFDTYVGAAVAVHGLGLISDAGLRAVADATLDGFHGVPWRTAEQQAQARRRLLHRDLAALPVPPRVRHGRATASSTSPPHAMPRGGARRSD